MKEQIRIAPHQAAFLTTAVTFSGLALLFSTGSELGHEQWMCLVVPAVVGVFLYYFYGWLAGRMQGLTLDMVYQSYCGKWSGKLLAAYFLLFFLLIGSYFLIAGIGFWSVLDMPKTPVLVFILLSLATCLLIARMGLEVIARCGMLFLIFFFLAIALDTAFLVPEMEFERILPVGVMDDAMILRISVHVMVTLFGLLPLTLHFLPLVSQPRKIKRSLGIGLLLGFGYVTVAAFRNVFLFGDVLFLENYATLKALRLVEWGSGISRLELLGLAVAMATILLAMSLLLLACSKLLVVITGWRQRTCQWPVALAMGAVMYLFGSNTNYIDSSGIFVLLGMACLLTIPLLIITVVKLQKTNCKTETTIL